MKKETYRLNLKNDYVFKMMHYYNEEIGKQIFASLVEAFTGIQVTHVEFAPTELYPADVNAKGVRLDLNARIETRDAVNMEMQLSHIEQVPERAGFYTASLYVTQNNKGKAYSDHANAHCIFLCAKDRFQETDRYEHHFQMMDQDTGIVLTSKMKAHIIELDKGMKKIEDTEDVRELSLMEKWIVFLMGYQENGNDPQIERLLKSEEIFVKAVEVLKVISQEEKIRERAIARERHLKDEAQLRYEAQQRERKAREEGFEEGFEDGVEKGAKNRQIRIAKKLLNLGMDVEVIAEGTELTVDQVLEIKGKEF